MIYQSSWRHPVLCQVLGRAAAAFPQWCPADASRLQPCGEPPQSAAGSAEGSAGEGLGGAGPGCGGRGWPRLKPWDDQGWEWGSWGDKATWGHVFVFCFLDTWHFIDGVKLKVIGGLKEQKYECLGHRIRGLFIRDHPFHQGFWTMHLFLSDGNPWVFQDFSIEHLQQSPTVDFPL